MWHYFSPASIVFALCLFAMRALTTLLKRTPEIEAVMADFTPINPRLLRTEISSDPAHPPEIIMQPERGPAASDEIFTFFLPVANRCVYFFLIYRP
jgi:hypothetical protein